MMYIIYLNPATDNFSESIGRAREKTIEDAVEAGVEFAPNECFWLVPGTYGEEDVTRQDSRGL